MKDKQTLIILSPGFPENEEDSTCLPAQQAFVLALKKNFPLLKIIVIAFEYPFTRSVYLWNGIEVISFNGWKKRKISKLLLWRDIKKSLKKIKNENNLIGLLSFWCGQCGLIGKKFGKKNNIPHFIWILGQDAKRDNNYVKWIHPTPTDLIALSDFLNEEFYKNHLIRAKNTIPYGIEPNQFPPGDFTRDIDILGAGSLIPLKQYDLFINIIKELSVFHPTLKSCICGDGSEKIKLKSQIEILQLQQHISLLGEQPHEEVLQLMKRSRIFLHPSSYEGFSSACLEGAYAGCHVISFCKPMNSPIDHWHIVKTKEGMTRKILEILESKTTRYEAVLPFEINNCAKQIMKLFGGGMN